MSRFQIWREVMANGPRTRYGLCAARALSSVVGMIVGSSARRRSRLKARLDISLSVETGACSGAAGGKDGFCGTQRLIHKLYSSHAKTIGMFVSTHKKAPHARGCSFNHKISLAIGGTGRHAHDVGRGGIGAEGRGGHIKAGHRLARLRLVGNICADRLNRWLCHVHHPF